MAHIKLNLSGHQNDALEAQGFIFPGALQVDLADEQLPQKVADFLRPYVGSGDVVTYAPPGLSALAAIVQAALHGLSGSFPQLQILERGEDGFVPGVKHDLQDFRNNVARAGRDGIVNL